MKRTLLLFFTLSTSLLVSAQEPPGYTLGKSADNVDCYYRISDCNGKTVLFLVFDNRNPSAVNVSWTELFSTKQVPEKTPGYKQKELLLAPGLSEAADCSITEDKVYIIDETDVHRAYRADITGFEFGNVQITPAN